MVIVLLKLIFSLLGALSDLITRVIFTTTARVVVQMIQTLKAPGEGSQRVLEQITNLIRTCLEYLLGLMVEAVTTVLSSLFDLVKEGVLTSSSGLSAAVVGLLEKSKASLDEAVEDIPEVLDAFVKMLAKIVAAFWNNWNDALAYVSENVLK